VKGSHIVVPKLFDHDRAYIFQNDDKRIVFAIPYETDYTLIGTTDVDYTGDPGNVKIDADEIAYLCKLASSYFKQPIAPRSVVWTYSGVRPLMDDGATAAQEATRDYVLELDDKLGAPLLNIFGGKITTYRRLAEAAIDKLDGLLTTGQAWTAGATLPGGDFPVDGVAALERDVQRLAPSLSSATVHRLVRTYGTRAKQIVTGRDGRGMGQTLGADLSESEAAYLVANEWARTADDILWRRTKLGLRVTPEETARLSRWLAEHAPRLA
jgi:glycerol-3-phosphate dehydrogenase